MPLVKPGIESTDAVVVIEQSATAQLTDPDPAIRRLAIQALGASSENIAQLIAALKIETSMSVIETIFTVLMKIGNDDAATSLMMLLRADEPLLRNGAIEALKTMPSFVLERVTELFQGPSDIRIFAAEILGALPVAGTLPYLLEYLENETEVNVCAAIVEAMMECLDDTAIGPLQDLLSRFPDDAFLEFAVRAALARGQNA